MFNNGLLASFIPEFLMVLGYLLCLIAPHFKADKQAETLSPVTVQITSTEQNQLSTYLVHFSDFQPAETVLTENDTKSELHSVAKEKSLWYSIPDLTDGLTFKQFSRPPPCFVC